MKQTIYKYDPIKIKLKNDRLGDVVKVRDYFQYYTTGIEEIPFKNESLYFETTRFENERTDVLAFNFFESEDISDLILALNNDVYLWDSVIDYEMKEKVIQNKLKMLERNKYKDDPNKELDSYDKKYYSELFDKELQIQNDYQKTIVLPKLENLQRVIRDIRKYLDGRKVT